jgi:hypothetical protein
MEKRAYKRIPVNIKIRYTLWNPLFWKKQYYGTIKNLSEKGMFISTKTIFFPRDSLIEIYIPHKKNAFYVPAKVSNIVWRHMLSDSSCDSIGIELSRPPQDYLELVESLKNSKQFHIPYLSKYVKKWWS